MQHLCIFMCNKNVSGEHVKNWYSPTLKSSSICTFMICPSNFINPEPGKLNDQSHFNVDSSHLVQSMTSEKGRTSRSAKITGTQPAFRASWRASTVVRASRKIRQNFDFCSMQRVERNNETSFLKKKNNGEQKHISNILWVSLGREWKFHWRNTFLDDWE